MTPPPAKTANGRTEHAGATPQSRRAALARAHVATLLFGASGIFGKLCQCSAPVLVCGRAIFAVAALTLAGLGKKRIADSIYNVWEHSFSFG